MLDPGINILFTIWNIVDLSEHTLVYEPEFCSIIKTEDKVSVFLYGEIDRYFHQLSGHTETDDQCTIIQDQKKGLSSAVRSDKGMFQKIGPELFICRMSDQFRSIDRYRYDLPSNDLWSDDPSYGLDLW